MSSIALALSSCSLASWRQTFDLRSPEESVRVEVWMARHDFGSGGAWTFFDDTWLFPFDWIASTVWGIKAIGDPDLAVAGGPAGWIASLLPCVTLAPGAMEIWTPTALDWHNRGCGPWILDCDPSLVAAVRDAPDDARLRRAILAAIASGLATERPTHTSRSHPAMPTREQWQHGFEPIVVEVGRLQP